MSHSLTTHGDALAPVAAVAPVAVVAVFPGSVPSVPAPFPDSAAAAPNFSSAQPATSATLLPAVLLPAVVVAVAAAAAVAATLVHYLGPWWPRGQWHPARWEARG